MTASSEDNNTVAVNIPLLHDINRCDSTGTLNETPDTSTTSVKPTRIDPNGTLPIKTARFATKNQKYIYLSFFLFAVSGIFTWAFLSTSSFDFSFAKNDQTFGTASDFETYTEMKTPSQQQDEIDEQLQNLPFYSFADKMRAFPWNDYLKSMATNPDEYSMKLVDTVLPFVTAPPVTPINEECKPPKLPDPETIDCSKYPEAFTGEKRSKPAKIAHMVQLGYDIDVLEIHLNEVYDVVDKFFIVETMRTHFKVMPKRLVWELVKKQPRFDKFKDKIVHVVLDDIQTSEMVFNRGGMWKSEQSQENIRMAKFLEWNDHAKLFQNEDDMIGFGDADEVASRQNLHLLRWCVLKSAPIDIGIWFPFGLLTQTFASDWSVPNYPYTLGDPSVYSLKAAKAAKTPTRRRGKSGNYLLGGIHLTHHGHLPFQIIKNLVCTECGATKSKIMLLKNHLEDGNMSKIRELERQMASSDGYRNRIVPLEQALAADPRNKDVFITPWFMKCNPDRYPSWHAKPDPRIGDSHRLVIYERKKREINMV